MVVSEEVIFDVIIAGAGIFGLCSALHLARSGFSVALCDSKVNRSASLMSGAMIRLFHEDERLVEWTAESLPFWQLLIDSNQEAGVWCGSVWVEHERERQGYERRVQAIVLRFPWAQFEFWSKEDLERQFPQMLWPQDCFALHEPQAGHLNARLVLPILRRECQGAGVHMISEAVHAVCQAGHAAHEVTVGEMTFRARHIVLCLGAWTPQWLNKIEGKVSTKIRSKAIQAYRCRSKQAVWNEKCFVDARTGLYGRPLANGQAYLGFPTSAWDLDPDEAPSLERKAFSQCQWHGQRIYPATNCLTHSPLTAMDAYTESGVGVIEEVAPRVWVNSGWSGAGFKLAPAIAQRLTLAIQQTEASR